MRTKLRKGQTAIGSFQIALSEGRSLEIDIYTQEDGGVYVSQYLARQKGGVTAGQTCFYCGSKLLGCITCPRGQSPEGNCITGRFGCSPLTTNPAKKQKE